MLSLQPAKDSAFAVADISPKKLKEALLSIATEDALSDVPRNTANILAWNGGGVSNFTEIVQSGGEKVASGEKKPVDLSEKAGDLVEKFEELEHKLEKDVKDFLRQIKTQ
jgi:cerevisin